MDTILKSPTRTTIDKETWIIEIEENQKIFETNFSISELRVRLPFARLFIHVSYRVPLGNSLNCDFHGGKWIIGNYNILDNDVRSSIDFVFRRSENSYMYFEITLPPIYNFQDPIDISPLQNKIYIDVQDNKTVVQYRLATTSNLAQRLKEFQDMTEIFYRVNCHPNFPKQREVDYMY
jgi:hypothetical protein